MAGGWGKHQAEIVVYGEVEYRRYPTSSRRSDSRYFKAFKGARDKHYLHRRIWEDANGPIPEGCHIHHKDGDASNNALDNLECLDGSEHMALHSGEEERRVWASSHADRIRPLAAKWARTEEGRAALRLRAEKQGFGKWGTVPRKCQRCGVEFQASQNGTHLYCSNKCKAAARRESGVDDVTKTCVNCGKEFVANRYARAKSCSRLCAASYRRRTG